MFEKGAPGACAVALAMVSMLAAPAVAETAELLWRVGEVPAETAGGAGTPDARYDAWLQKGSRAEQASDWHAADLAYREALAISRGFDPGDARRLRVHEELGRLHGDRLKQPLMAREHWEEAWALRRAAGTAVDPDSWRVRSALVNLYQALHDWPAVERVQREVLAAMVESDRTAEDVASALAALAETIDRQRPGDPEATELHERAMALPLAIWAWANARRSAAAHLAEQGRPSEAVELLWEVLRESEREGAEAADLAYLHERLGDAALAAGDLDLAESAFRQALEANRGRYGDGHPYLHASRQRLAGLLVRQRRWSEARVELETSLEVARRAWGESSTAVIGLGRALEELARRESGASDATGPLTSCECTCRGLPEEILDLLAGISRSAVAGSQVSRSS